MDCGTHASLSSVSQSLLKLMSIESIMPSNHLILCHPLLFLPSVFPSIRVFSNDFLYICDHVTWQFWIRFFFLFYLTQSCIIHTQRWFVGNVNCNYFPFTGHPNHVCSCKEQCKSHFSALSFFLLLGLSINFFFFFLAMCGLHCCTGFSLVAVSRGCTLVAMCRLLIEVAPLIVKWELLPLRSGGSSLAEQGLLPLRSGGSPHCGAGAQ